jgi:hypothetical protein
VYVYDKIKFAVVTKETLIFSTKLNHKAQRYANIEEILIRDIFNGALSISRHTDETQRRFWHSVWLLSRNLSKWLEDDHKNISQENQSLDRHMNPRVPECEYTLPYCLVNIV